MSIRIGTVLPPPLDPDPHLHFGSSRAAKHRQAPQGVALTPGVSSLVLSWRTVSGANAYLVSELVDGRWVDTTIQDPTVGTFLLDNLPIAPVTLAVTALYPGGERSLKSRSVTATPIDPNPPPARPPPLFSP